MTLREVAARIPREGGALHRYFSAPRADGTRACSFGGEVSAAQYAEIERLVRPQPLTPEERARMRARAAADRH